MQSPAYAIGLMARFLLCVPLLAACGGGETPGDEVGTGPAPVAVETGAAPPEVRTSPLSLEGTSPVEWSGHERRSHFVTAADGVRLAVDAVLPTGYTGEGEAPTAFPVIFRYTPYHRTSIDPETGEVALVPWEFFLKRGYAYVAADMRGTGASFGWNDLMTQRFVEDGGAIVDWIAAQPWSDGNVGMIGGSYEGWSQFAVAAAQPEALKAIVPFHTGWDALLLQPGGVFAYAFAEMWTAMTDFINHNNSFEAFPADRTNNRSKPDGCEVRLIDGALWGSLQRRPLRMWRWALETERPRETAVTCVAVAA